MASIPFNPVLMTDVITALGPPGGAATSEQQFNEQLLRNPSSQPMLLDEIRFELDITHVLVPGACVWAQIRIDGNYLTKGFVPINMLGKLLNWSGEWPVVTAVPNIMIGPTLTPFVYVWKLPKPLFMPASALSQITVRYMNTLFTSPQVVGTVLGPTQTLVNVRVVLVGRTLPAGTQPPPQYPVPYVAAWTPAPVICGGAPIFYNAESTEADLVNDLDRSMVVQRFLGRITVWDTGANFRESYNASWVAGGGATNNLEVGSRFLFVKMVRGDGRIAVRDETPFHHLFQAIDKSWTVNTVVPSGQFYKVFLRTDNMTAQPAARHLPQVSMVGYRNVRT